MRQEESLRREIHDALDPLIRPAPELATKAMELVHAEESRTTRGGRIRTLVQATGVLAAAALVAIGVIAIHQVTNRGQAPPQTLGPTVGPLTTATGPGGQVAWLEGQAGLTAFDPNGRVVATIDAHSALRSADGGMLYAIVGPHVEVYNAATGRHEQTITRRGSGEVAALSPDGLYLTILEATPPRLEVVDLIAGRSVAYTRLGSAFPDSGSLFVLVSPRASRIYAFGGSWQYPAVAALQFDGSTLRVEREALGGQQEHIIPNCLGMSPGNSISGLPEQLLPDGKTMVSFCPGNGLVSWFDLDRLTLSAHVQVPERNPFWLSPVFSRDGSTLYVQEPGTGRVTVVDLRRRAIVRSDIVEAPTAFNPFPWLVDRLFPPAFAGGIPRTAALSPDGATLYVTGGFGRPMGVGAVRLRDFHVSGQWTLEGGGSLWLSGDGRTLYALNNGGDRLSILHLESGSVTIVKLSPAGYAFLALPT